MVVEGRPTQVLVPTHEGAKAPEALPYLGAKWFPMPILNIFGRCARAEPAVHTHAAVWYGWRESFFTKDAAAYNDHMPLLSFPL